jgi:hypothetical protein
MRVHYVFEEAVEDNEIDDSFSNTKKYSFSTSMYHCLFDHRTMNSVEKVANLYHQIQLQEKQYEKEIAGNGDELEVGMKGGCNARYRISTIQYAQRKRIWKTLLMTASMYRYLIEIVLVL